MRFDEAEGPRAELALQMLSEGKPVNFRGLGLRLSDSGTLECRVFTQWAPENVTDAIAHEERAVGVQTLEELVKSPPFAALLQMRPQTWELLSDYGQGSIRVCHFDLDEIRWGKGYPRET